MTKRLALLCVTLTGVFLAAVGQTLNTTALKDVNPAVARQVFEVARYVNLDSAQQQALAKAFKSENASFMKKIEADGGILSVTSERELTRMRDKALGRILDGEQLRQYWRGVYDKEAGAEASAIANRFRKEYGITDQNWKFIRIAFYKIGLETRVNNKLLPAGQARKANEQVRQEMLKSIEEKGDIRVNDDMTLTVLKPFDPNTLHRAE